MERRDFPRFPTEVPVRFSLLGSERIACLGHIRDVSTGGFRLATAFKLEPGSFLRIEFDDCVLFGEVRFCCPWLDGFVAGVYAERVLLGKSDLAKLLMDAMGHAQAVQGAVSSAAL